MLFIASLLVLETGGTVGRVGGDEFLSIVEEQESLAALENCLGWVNDPAHSRFVLRGSSESLHVACSDQLMGMADAAMYEAKNNGKCGYVIQRFLICNE